MKKKEVNLFNNLYRDFHSNNHTRKCGCLGCIYPFYYRKSKR